MIAAMLATSWPNGDSDDDYERCFRDNPCPHDNQDLSKLSEQERHKERNCRIKRLMKCSQPEEE